jgi:hypothetical protein
MLINMTGVQGEETSEEALLQRALAMSMDRWEPPPATAL